MIRKSKIVLLTGIFLIISICLCACGTTAGSSNANKAAVTAGSYITFGSYEQDNNISNGKESIEWLVLDVQGSQALVISRYGLNCKPYNTKSTDITWETCTLRTWLNNDFLNAAFSAKEQKAIVSTTVNNSKSQLNSKWSTDGGSNTNDKIFLLSYKEANTYFKNDEARMCVPTKYAIANGAYTSEGDFEVDGADTGSWWLRSPSRFQDCAAVVYDDGENTTDDVGNSVSVSFNMVRPALWINLDSGIF